MQYPAAADPDCSSGARAAMLEGSLSCLWPGNTPEDVIRRALAVILCEDPDYRLRVAHLEPLLHMALGPQQLPCSSGRLQALLTDPSTAKIFPVDFSAQVPDWRSRVVYLDMHQLTATLSAAKAHRQQQQQQQHADVSGVDQDAMNTRLQRGSSSGCSESAALDSHHVAPGGERSGSSVTTDPSQHQQHTASSTGSHNRPAPLALDSIFGNSPVFNGGGMPAGRASSQAGGAAAGSMQAQQPGHHSSSMPAVTPKEPGSDSRGDSGSGHQGMSSSLFGGSFEVPYAIASCWATGSNQGGSFGTAHPGAKGQNPVLADTLGAAVADGGGSSSMASSTRSFAGPAAASGGAAGAMPARPATGSSRLRNASSMQGGGDGAAGEPAAANSIDVCTPRSGIAAPAGADRSPLLSSADCEEDAGEYSEAALVFGSVSNAANGGGAALAASGGEDRGAAAPGRAVTGERSASSGIGGPAADSSGQLETEESFSMQGVDWSCMAGLQQQQQQPEAAYHYQQQAAQQQQQQQHALLFGLDDFGGDGLTPRSSGPASAAAHNSALAAAATGALTARRLLMEHAGMREDCPTGSFHNPNGGGFLGSHHSPHHRAALASSLGALGSGSAPATLQQQQQHEQLLLAAAAAAGSGRGFGGYGGHERLLLDPEGLQGYGLSGQQHMAALASSLQGGSYGSGGLLGSDRSLGSGLWASPAAMQQHFLLQQQHQRQQQQAVAAAAVAAAAAAAQSQQQQQMRASLGGGGADGTVDTSFGIDQMGKVDQQQHPVGSAGTPGKGGSLSANAFGRPAGSSQGGQQELAVERSSSSSIGAPGASALTPRLTGWASVAAKEPPAGSGPQQQQQQAQQQGSGMKQQGQAGSTGSAASKAGGEGGQGKAVAKLPPRVKAEVQHLVSQFQGVLKLEDFDDGVVHQLNAKRTEDEAVAAVRNIAHYELGTIQHMAAYLNHVVKNFNAAAAAAAAAAADTTVGLSNALAAAAAAAVAANSAAAAVHGGRMQQLLGAGMLSGNGSLGSTVGAGRGGPAGGGGTAGGLGAYGGQIRLTSVPVSTKAMLQKLPLKVFKQIELLVQNSAYLEWRHFDAGVIKVLSQLSKLCEGDVFEELELLAATDLSNVEYMPAYLNKRLNNKLWSRRKAEGHVPG